MFTTASAARAVVSSLLTKGASLNFPGCVMPATQPAPAPQLVRQLETRPSLRQAA